MLVSAFLVENLYKVVTINASFIKAPVELFLFICNYLIQKVNELSTSLYGKERTAFITPLTDDVTADTLAAQRAAIYNDRITYFGNKKGVGQNITGQSCHPKDIWNGIADKFPNIGCRFHKPSRNKKRRSVPSSKA